MATIRTYPMQNSTVLRLNSEKDFININPEYQRNGEVWTLEKKQLLIDSILNDYDIPKLYFHLMPRGTMINGRVYDYAIIDGRQRIEAIWGFLNGDYTLAEDFVFLADDNINARRFTYSDLAREFPKLRVRFDSYVLPVILVETDDLDLIEDMFSRLNEAVPLNAAEKRNALGGNMAKAIRELASHVLFTHMVRFSNRRYQHREVAARLLFIEYCYVTAGRLQDTKKPYLDKMVSTIREMEDPESTDVVQRLYSRSEEVLDAMESVFSTQDYLLRSQAIISVYYLIFRVALYTDQIDKISRAALLNFFDALSANRTAAENDIATANYEYLEFDRMSQQGTNDAASIRERTRILCEYLSIDYSILLDR